MSIQLIKGGRFNLSQELPNLKRLAIALGWQVNVSNHNCDIDASAFMLGADGRIPHEDYMVFYNNTKSLDGAVKQSATDQSSPRKGYINTLYSVDFSLMDASIEQIVLIVTIHDAESVGLNFSKIQNAFISLYDRDRKTELTRYELKENFTLETALEFGRLYKKNRDWRFQAVGQGYNSGLRSFVEKYYVEE
ncbi:MAG: TerD family protein [Oscillatoriales cyanobacterium]|nr:MAG: TerD family protein [Oscillatoriales cyanobacterium]TAH15173.1 MAG: TerD family protein [Oscillatoriales cyanobacterium]